MSGCCVDAKEMAKIDSPNWQNNCGCGPDEEPSDSVCIYEVPNGTKRLEEELHAKFPSLIKTFSENIICGPKSNFKAKRAIVINSKWIYEEFERVNWTQTIMHWKSIVEKKRRVNKTKEVQDGDDDDRHKPEGVIMLEIDRFNEFMDKPLFTYQLPSQPVYIRGLPWKIIASPTAQWITRMDRKHFPICKGEKALGFYLQCNDDVSDPSWSCTAEAILRVHSQTAGIEDYTKWIVHTFNAKENSRGYSEFMTCETLADPANGYLKNDTIKLSVQVWADAPQGVQ
uniref:MATH domain-containing protein n=1 Tax=Acrobeloides nanus TaxID=290746 RepID=A0A914EFE9_9BILA